MYHFAPMELYILFAIGVACYAISASMSRHSFSKTACLVGWLVPFLLLASWAPLLFHYVVILFWLPPIIFIDLNDVLSNPNDFHEISQYAAYYIHIITVVLFFFWICFLLSIRDDEQDGPSEEE